MIISGEDHQMRFRRRWRGLTKRPASQFDINRPRIILTGSPNVGKSLIFGRLTGSYVSVSNYPGTTVALDTGKCILNGREYTLIDSPGIYSLLPVTEEEKVTKNLLLLSRPDLVLHVVDAKNLERMLPFTLQLIEAKLPLILVLNMMDEAESIGIEINYEELARKLGLDVVPVVAVTCRGFPELILRMSENVAV